MTSRDFVYWLQGFYEISGNVKLTEDQENLIDKHLQMVFVLGVPPRNPDGSEVVEFAYWLKECLSTGFKLDSYAVRTKLNLVFEHDLDPSHSDDPEMQAKLNAIHSGTQADTVEGLADAPATLVLVGPRPFKPHNRDQNGILCRC